jgi:alpha/beta hydrolase family protein
MSAPYAAPRKSLTVLADRRTLEGRVTLLGGGSNHIEVEGLRIAFERVGEGLPLVLLHGALSDSRNWRRQLDELSNEFTVVAWDAPGFGRSSDPPETFGLPDYADCLAAFVDAWAWSFPTCWDSRLAEGSRWSYTGESRRFHGPWCWLLRMPAGRVRCHPKWSRSASTHVYGRLSCRLSSSYQVGFRVCSRTTRPPS